MLPILLASSSRYRQNLLGKLGLPFECASPDIDETPKHGESADALVARLSQLKAEALVKLHPNKLIIGSDQVAELDGNILGKPHTHERASAQLLAASGRQVIFKTGICLMNATNGNIQVAVERFSVHFRPLSSAQIEGYLNIERPYDCAGSFKAEGLGISLFTKLCGDDPNTLIGLPLIRLVQMLANEGLDPLLVNQ